MTISSTNPQIKTKISLLLPGELIAKLVRHCSFLKPVTSLSVAPAGVGRLRSRPELRWGIASSGISSSGISSPPGGFCSAQPCFRPLEARCRASSLSRLLFHDWFLLPSQTPLNAWSPKTPVTFCSPRKALLSVPHSPAIHFLPDYLMNKRVFFPPNYIKIRKRKIKYIQKD